MEIAQFAFTAAAFLKISILVFPAREQIYIYTGWSRDLKVHLPLTFILSVITFGVPCFYPNVSGLLGLIGGLMTGSLGYSLPVLMQVASLKQKKKLCSFSGVFSSLLLTFIVVIQLLATYAVITED